MLDVEGSGRIVWGMFPKPITSVMRELFSAPKVVESGEGGEVVPGEGSVSRTGSSGVVVDAPVVVRSLSERNLTELEGADDKETTRGALRTETVLAMAEGMRGKRRLKRGIALLDRESRAAEAKVRKLEESLKKARKEAWDLRVGQNGYEAVFKKFEEFYQFAMSFCCKELVLFPGGDLLFVLESLFIKEEETEVLDLALDILKCVALGGELGEYRINGVVVQNRLRALDVLGGSVWSRVLDEGVKRDVYSFLMVNGVRVRVGEVDFFGLQGLRAPSEESEHRLLPDDLKKDLWINLAQWIFNGEFSAEMKAGMISVYASFIVMDDFYRRALGGIRRMIRSEKLNEELKMQVVRVTARIYTEGLGGKDKKKGDGVLGMLFTEIRGGRKSDAVCKVLIEELMKITKGAGGEELKFCVGKWIAGFWGRSLKESIYNDYLSAVFSIVMSRMWTMSMGHELRLELLGALVPELEERERRFLVEGKGWENLRSAIENLKSLEVELVLLSDLAREQK